MFEREPLPPAHDERERERDAHDDSDVGGSDASIVDTGPVGELNDDVAAKLVTANVAHLEDADALVVLPEQLFKLDSLLFVGPVPLFDGRTRLEIFAALVDDEVVTGEVVVELVREERRRNVTPSIPLLV